MSAAVEAEVVAVVVAVVVAEDTRPVHMSGS